jgi:hypothetical protein
VHIYADCLALPPFATQQTPHCKKEDVGHFSLNPVDSELLRAPPHSGTSLIFRSTSSAPLLLLMSDAVSLSPVQDSGFVTVTLVSARGLMGKNSDSKSDPFCIVEIGSQVHFSKIKKATCDPIWSETYVFDIPMPLPSPFYLSVSVWNQPKFSNGRDTKGAFLGRLQIDLGQVGRSEANGRFFELEKRSSRSHVSGGLEMKIAITSENDAAKMKQQEKERARALQQAMQKQIDDEKEARSAENLRQANAKVSSHHNRSS